nr:filaggrin-2-like isoform X2 [Physcomitrium patens]|eukprot:XP_024384757.1 filaggrin-2-like isoform X2 [Physcomitrella patens]
MSSHGRGGFQASKCKTQLRMGSSRMKRFCNKKLDCIADTGKEVAGLLKAGNEDSARSRVEEIIREKNLIEAYELLTACAERISSQMSSIDSQETCPSGIKGDISTLLYASSKRTELVDFSQLHPMFVDKYGEEFVTTAIELRQGCGVDVKVVEKLLVNPVTEAAKFKVMKEIASDHNVEWNPAPGLVAPATMSAGPIEDLQSSSVGSGGLNGEAPLPDSSGRIKSKQEDLRAGSVGSSVQSREPPPVNPREGMQASSEERRTGLVYSRVPSKEALLPNPPGKMQARPGSTGSSVRTVSVASGDPSREAPPGNPAGGMHASSEERRTSSLSSSDPSREAPLANPPGRTQARPSSMGSGAPGREAPLANPPGRMQAGSEDSFSDDIRVDSNSRKMEGQSSWNSRRESDIFPASSVHQFVDTSRRHSGGMIGKNSSWDQTGSAKYVGGESSLYEQKENDHTENLGAEGKGVNRSKATHWSDRISHEDDWVTNIKTTSGPDGSLKKPADKHEGSGRDSPNSKPVGTSQKAHSVHGSEGSDRRVGIVGKSEARFDSPRDSPNRKPVGASQKAHSVHGSEGNDRRVGSVGKSEARFDSPRDSPNRKPVGTSQKAHSVHGSEGSVGKSEARFDSPRKPVLNTEYRSSESGDEVDDRDRNRRIAKGSRYAHKKKNSFPRSDYDDYRGKGQVGDDLGYSEVPRNSRDPTSMRDRKERDRNGRAADDQMGPRPVRQGKEGVELDKRQSFPMESVERDKYSATRHRDEFDVLPRTGSSSGRLVAVRPDEDRSDKSRGSRQQNSYVDRSKQYLESDDFSSSDDDELRSTKNTSPGRDKPGPQAKLGRHGESSHSNNGRVPSHKSTGSAQGSNPPAVATPKESERKPDNEPRAKPTYLKPPNMDDLIRIFGKR